MNGAPLPIERVLTALRDTLGTHDALVLEAPPGAGKTTRVPLALLQEPWLGSQKIVMLEPRRLAARAAAERMAALLGEPVGATVGYRMRLDTRIGPRTRIEVLTEGVLTRLVQSDPSLEGVGLVIFDEFHERSLDADLGLALCLHGRELFRDTHPLRLLLMSATLDGAGLASVLGDAPIVRCAGRSHPVTVEYCPPPGPDRALEPAVHRTVLRALDEQPGSILVFLPGQAEIHRVHEALSAGLDPGSGVSTIPLYGDLSLEDQRRAIQPTPEGRRKVVLATALAETSLTIEGIGAVVDAGLSRLPRFDPATGMTRLHTGRLSRAASVQRMGRAGRLGPGRCYRLWSPTQQDRLPPFTPAEILQADLAPLALQLLYWGVEDPGELKWLDPPPAGAYAQALDLLERLGALRTTDTERRSLTPHGEAMARLPAHPRLAHLLLMGQRHGLRRLAGDLAALLSERDPLPRGEADLSSRLALLRGAPPPARRLQGAIRRLRQQSQRFQKLCPTAVREPVPDPEHPRWTGFLLACAYPDRVAQRRGAEAGAYRLSGGRAAHLSIDDPLSTTPWLAVAQLGARQGDSSERIYLASELDPTLFDGLLAQQVDEHTEVGWDARAGRLRAERLQRVGALTLSHRELRTVAASVRRRAGLDLVRTRGLAVLPWTEALRQWQARVMLLRAVLDADARSPWPDVSDAQLLRTLDAWLGPHLDHFGHLTHLATLDLSALLRALLAWPLSRQLERLAPSHYTLPAGARVKIDYLRPPPILAVRLQALFGCSETPQIAEGRVTLRLHLLSPAQRPVQITQDLPGFWKRGYHVVRKEMRARYPKHHWPEDPFRQGPKGKG